jgi:tetratricopeptide (TPR) repeat protein
MNKLSNLTIIPDDLYVERDADQQLKRVIDDMGRPAYVLVARQMGKTNLLLHAKRKYQKKGDIFVYLDVSNPLETVLEFFNSIVDAIIDTGLLPDSVVSELLQEREKAPPLAAHRLHERELRKILAVIPGKLVIFLDEVDALGSRQYSDQVFAYIRSIYFAARTNFPEFNRLSYVLSGVAEPSELIKNKDISPFNIGQKIYLDDFSRDEFNQLCKKADQAFDLNALERIFYWTSGNPRMSWDILAWLGERHGDGTHVGESHVDAAVDELYLKNFDLPPVDHIRNLVEKDIELQTALISMHFGKSDAIPSHVTNKLYLAGIARLESSSGLVKIRNRIIADSLSLGWVQELEGKLATPIDRAYAAYQQHRWADALVLLEECFKTTDSESVRAEIAIDIGRCKFQTGAYEQAITWLEEYIQKKHFSANLHYRTLYWIGLANHAAGNSQKSFEAFLQASEDSAVGVNPFFYECLVNRCVHYGTDWRKYLEETEAVVKQILDLGEQPEQFRDNPSRADHLRCSAYVHLAHLRRRQGRIPDALNILLLAMHVGDKKFSVGIALERARLQDSGASRILVASDMARSIIEQGYVIEVDSALYPLAFTLQNAGELTAILAVQPEEKLFEDFISYIRRLLHETPSDFVEVIVYSAGIAGSSGAVAGTAKLFRIAFEGNSPGIDANTRRMFATSALLIASVDVADSLERRYFDEYLLAPDSDFLATDYRIVYDAFQLHLKNDTERAELVLSAAKRLAPGLLIKSEGSDSYDAMQIGSLIIEACDVELLFEIGKYVEASQRAAVWLKRASSTNRVTPHSYFNQDVLQSIYVRVRDIAFSKKAVPQYVRGEKKIGRNSIVTVVVAADGTRKTGKYKNFESDIRVGNLLLDSTAGRS